jgi:aconitate decarboxylase
MNETTTLARFLSALTYEDLPDDVVETAKLCVLDIVGVGIGSTTWPWSEIVFKTMADEDSPGESSVWGKSSQTSARNAALINGTTSHGIEMDDRVPRSSMHPGCYAVSAAMAVTEQKHGTGRQLITSVVSGYELGLRVGSTMKMRKGVHKSGHKGIWPSVGAAARAAGLNAETMEYAFGVAGSMASALFRFHQDPLRTMVKRLHGGLAAHNGILATELAEHGFIGPSEILEGEFGYILTYGDDEFEPRWEKLTEHLGGQFRILDREVKPYASWGGGHNAIDAVAAIQSLHRVDPAAIDSVRIGGSTRMVFAHELKEPESVMAAQYSLPFITAVAIARGAEALVNPVEIWKESTLTDDVIAQVVAKTEVVIDSDLDEISLARATYGGARVTISMVDGAEHESVVIDSKGTVENPMSRQEIERKFRLVTERVLTAKQADHIIELCASLDQLDDLWELGSALRSRSQ